MPLHYFLCNNKECKKTGYEILVPLKRHGKKIKCPECKTVLERHWNAPYFKVK